MAGDAETGVAIMQMEAGLDTGTVLAEAREAMRTEATAFLSGAPAAAGMPFADADRRWMEYRPRPRPGARPGRARTRGWPRHVGRLLAYARSSDRHGLRGGRPCRASRGWRRLEGG